MSAMKVALLAVLAASVSAVSNDGPCFEFENNYLEFYPDNFDISDSIHYKLNFRTTSESGTILFARGSHDYEGLYLDQGRLVYHIINPSSYGTGRSFGARFLSDERVNNNTWFTVEVFRNRRVRRGSNVPVWERPPLQSGMFLRAEGSPKEERHVLPRRLVDVRLLLPLYVGGAGNEVGFINNFFGEIRNIQEKKHGRVLKYPSRNFNVKQCIDIVPPV